MGHTQEWVAQQIGFANKSAYANFERGRTMRAGNIERLRELIQRDDPPSPPPENLLASQLRTLADIVESADYPLEFRAKKFVSWIREMSEDVDCIVGPMLRQRDAEKAGEEGRK